MPNPHDRAPGGPREPDPDAATASARRWFAAPPVLPRGAQRGPRGGPKSTLISPSSRFIPDAAACAGLLGLAAVLVAFFGVFVGLPEWPKWGLAAVLTVASAIFGYQHRWGRKRELLAGLSQAVEALGFRELPDPKASLGPLGLLRARAFRGHRVSWALERAAPTETTILAGAPRSAFDHVHHLVVCWSVVGSPLPDFDLSPETFTGRAVNAVGGQDIDFDDDPDFSNRYRLRAHDEHAARRVFRPEVRRFFTCERDEDFWDFSFLWNDNPSSRNMMLVREGWHAESRDGWLIVYRPHPTAALTPQLLPEYFRVTQELFELLTARR